MKQGGLSFFAYCLLLIVYFFPFAVKAQTDIPEKYASTITQGDLKKHLTIVASAEMEGRETATPGQRKAAAYIESQFKQIGLLQAPGLDGYQQSYPLFKDSMIMSNLKIGKKKYHFGKDYIVSPNAAENQVIKSKQIIFVGYGISDKNYDDYAGKDVKGKVVVYFNGEPKQDGKYLLSGTTRNSNWGGFSGANKKAIMAKQKGALAAFSINPGMDSISKTALENAKKTNVYFPRPVTKENEKVIVIGIIPSTAREIFGEAEFNDLLSKAKISAPLNELIHQREVKLNFEYQKEKIPYSSTNVVGYLEGTDKKDEFVFLTGHYDHLGKRDSVIYYGADDDGSGTVSVIEMAQAFAKAKAEGHGPRRSIVFMTVSGEEKGLWGSEYYSDHPLVPLDHTTVDLNTDMVGRIDPGRKVGDSMNYVYVIGDDKLSSDLKPISSGVNSQYTHLELDYKFNDPADPERIYFRSDHYNFARKGVPIIFFFDGIHKDYHRPTDTVDKINFDLMEKRVRFIFLTAWSIANRDKMLKRDIPLVETR